MYSHRNKGLINAIKNPASSFRSAVRNPDVEWLKRVEKYWMEVVQKTLEKWVQNENSAWFITFKRDYGRAIARGRTEK